MNSDVNAIDISTIKAAQNGCRESLSFLTEQTKGKVFTFLYRMTLDYHLSEDLCQETMLNLVRSIGRLHFDCEEALWAWLFRTAVGKVQHHRRSRGNKRIRQTSLVDMDGISGMVARGDRGPATGLFRKEMIDAILQAMDALKHEYRSVIVLRCMNELSYAQIAAILGGTQLRNKMLFHRAKRALRQELTQKGMGRSHFLGALVAFASVTSWHCEGAGGASIVTTGTLKVGVAGAVLSAVTTKLGMIAASIVLALGLVTGITATRTHSTPQSGRVGRYAHLLPLLEDDEFAYPSSVVGAGSPDGDGFTGLDVSGSRSGPFPVSCEAVLVGRGRNEDLRLIVPAGHWVEVGFDGPIVDGPGPDLFFAGWYCLISRVFLTDGAGRAYELAGPTCAGDCNRFHMAAFDLSDLDVPFEPKGVRIRGLGNCGRYGGFELTCVRARIVPPSAGAHAMK